MLSCDLFQGEAVLVVRRDANSGCQCDSRQWIGGARVWAETPPPVFVAAMTFVRTEPDENECDFPEAFPACAVTRAITRAKFWVESHSSRVDVSGRFSLPLSNFPDLFSRSDLIAEQ